MTGQTERKLVYTTLLVLCSAIAILASPTVGIWSFLQVAAVIELTYLIGKPQGRFSSSRG